jgi:hypothetical protein
MTNFLTVVVAIIGAIGASGGLLWVDRRTSRAAGAEAAGRLRAAENVYERDAAERAQRVDGETAARLRAEIARLDGRLDECSAENTVLRRQLTAAVKRVATLEDTLRTNHITVPATGRSGGL